jgi:hypothetical protein
VVELGVTLAGAEDNDRPGLCSQCQGFRVARISSARYANIFCSTECEREFISAALASITVDDCIRMHQRLESLLTCGAQQPI